MDDTAATPVLAYDDGTAFEPQAVVLGYVTFKVIGLLFVTWATAILLSQAVFIGLNDIRVLGSPFVIRLLLPCALNAGVGSALIAYARPLSRRLFRIGGTLMPMPPAETLVALFAVAAGLYLAATAVAEVIRLSFTLLYEMRQNGASFLPTGAGEAWVGTLARLAVGVWMFLRPGWIVGQWRTRTRMP